MYLYILTDSQYDTEKTQVNEVYTALKFKTRQE